MPVPRLPLEIWTQISTYLDSESLSSLSQVNTTFHGMCNDESQFRRMIPTVRNYYTHPMQLFRRTRALYHPPTRCVSILGTAHFEIFATVQDNLLLVDECIMTATALPSGVTFNVLHMFNEEDDFLRQYERLSEYLLTVHTALPGGHIAFVHRRQPSLLVVQNLLENRTLKWDINRDESVVDRQIMNGSSIVPAGNNGECVAFFSAVKCVSIFNWQSGKYVRDVKFESEEAKLMMGECPAIDGMSVVGVFSERRNGFMREITCYAFDSDDIPFPAKFSISDDDIAEVVLRSMDKKTHVLIIRTPRGILEQGFVAYRIDKGKQTMWNGRLMMSSQSRFPDLQENGRVIAAKHGMTCIRAAEVPLTQQQMWIELLGRGKRITLAPTFNHRLWRGLQVIWSRRAFDGGYALLAGSAMWREVSKDVVDLVKIVNRGGKSRVATLKRWYASTFTDWCVVADHFVIAKRVYGGTVCVYHFDAFCGQARGACQCPGIVPPGFKWKVKDSHMKRRRWDS